ncbi:MAG: NifB/NifX family molybdenum-iron cluster-binding protein [Desulfobacteraceae bacterium]|jgi:nitrogen fixation protein NifX
MAEIRFAVASTDGIHVNEHFGKAKRFLIYDAADQLSWVEERRTEPLSIGDRDHPFDPVKFQRIASRLKDCAKVYVTQIGETPAAMLKALGIEPVVYEGSITELDPKAA